MSALTNDAFSARTLVSLRAISPLTRCHSERGGRDFSSPAFRARGHEVEESLRLRSCDLRPCAQSHLKALREEFQMLYRFLRPLVALLAASALASCPAFA